MLADPGRSNRPVGIDQEYRRPRDVPRVEADPVPDTVRAKHVARLIDQHVEGQPGVLDVAFDPVARLREDTDDLEASGAELWEMGGELTKLVAAVWSPGSAVKREKQRPVRQEFGERPHPAFLIGQRELRSPGER